MDNGHKSIDLWLFNGRTQMLLQGAIFMDKPLVVVNFKTYSSASASTADTLARKMEQFSNSNARMVAVVSAFDLHSVSNSCDNLEVWSQHLDPVGQGSFTGWLEPKTAISRGAQFIEKHFTLNKTSQIIRDHILSATPDEFKVLTTIGSELNKFENFIK